MPVKLRKVFCVVLVIVMFMACSVQAFAVAPITYYDISEVLAWDGNFFSKSFKPVSGSDGDFTLDVKLAEKATEEQQLLWTECMEQMVAGNYVAVFDACRFVANGDFFIYFVPEKVVSSNELGFYLNSSGCAWIRGYQFSFINEGGEVLFSGQTISYTQLSTSTPRLSDAYWLTADSIFYDGSLEVSYPVPVVSGINSLQITDDLNNSPVDPEPGPDPEPEPDPDPKPPYNPELPDIPAGNPEFVPYDTSMWWVFVKHIQKNVGSAATKGLLILGAFLGILIALRVVKKFFHI